MIQPSILLPAYHSRLIGRTTETADIGTLLCDPTVRMVTILGDSGAGKTRLALESAALVAGNFPDGVFFVALAPVDNPCFVLPTIAATLGVKEQGDESLLTTLQQVLQTKRVLLILDNVEQVSAASHEIRALLAETSAVTLLLTSQTALNLDVEIIFALPPLPIPFTNDLTPEEALEYPAVALFADRMQIVQQRFVLTPHNLTAVLEICRCLHGFPLAIELVAAHRSSLHPKDLLFLLRNHLAMQPYHKSNKLSSRDEILNPVLSWCYSQLSAPVQQVFRRAGIFQGGCTAEVLHSICSDLSMTRDEIERILQALSTKQLIQQETLPDQEIRYIMLDAIRAYTETLLKRRYEWRPIAEAHALFYLRLVNGTAAYFEGSAQTRWLKRLDSEVHNLRTALQWFESSHNWQAMATLLCDLDRYWLMRGLNSEVQVWTRVVLAQMDELAPGLQAKTYKLVGIIATRQGNFAQAYTSLHMSLAIYEQLGDQLEQAKILISLGATAIQQGQFVRGLSYLDQALRHECLEADSALMLNLLNNRGTAELQLGCYAAASLTFNRVVAICRATGNLNRLSSGLVNASVIDYYLGNYAAGRARCEEVLQIQESLGNALHSAASLTNLSATLIEEGDFELAQQAADQALAICTRLNEPVGSGELYALMARIARLEGRWDAAAQYSDQSVQLLQTIDEKRYLATSLREVALVALEAGDWWRSLDILRSSLRMLFDSHVIAECSANLEALARCAIGMGDVAFAACLWGAAHANRASLGTPLPPSERQRYEAAVDRAKSLLGAASFDWHWSQGSQTSLEGILKLLIDPMAGCERPVGFVLYSRRMSVL